MDRGGVWGDSVGIGSGVLSGCNASAARSACVSRVLKTGRTSTSWLEATQHGSPSDTYSFVDVAPLLTKFRNLRSLSCTDPGGWGCASTTRPTERSTRTLK